MSKKEMSKDDLRRIGREITKLRKKQKLSQSDLSEASGIARSTISAMESGRFVPTFTTIQFLAGALAVDVTDLQYPSPTNDMPPALAQFYHSQWVKLVLPTPSEVSFLRSQCAVLAACGFEPTPELLGFIVLLARRYPAK